MSRNAVSHFALAPRVNVKRSRFNRDHILKTTFNTGVLVPISVDEVLPGDTVTMDLSSFVRMATPINATMDNLYMDVYAFFVPNRLLWNHWTAFMGENTSGYWTQQTEYEVPVIGVGDGQAALTGDLLDYLGVEVGQAYMPFKPSALPIRAYWKIWNEWFRDENLQAPVNEILGDSETTYIPSTASGATIYTSGVTGGMLAPVNKYHDYFTSCLPQPQKGDPVLIPLSEFAPLNTKGEDTSDFSTFSDTPMFDIGGNGPYNFGLNADEDTYSVSDYTITASNLGVNGSSLAGTITELRTAFQIQKLLEADARGGSRYIELIRSHFGVTNPDYRLQRPEYLGGKRIPITINQVVQTSATGATGTPIGTTSGYSVTKDYSSVFTKSFTEHGILMVVAACRYHHTYSGLPKLFMRRTRYDFYWPELSNISEQPVFKAQLNNVGGSKVFGYQEAWAEYRYHPDQCTGYMRPGIIGSLGYYWTYADNYGSEVSLSDAWIREDPTNVDRTLAVSSDVAHQFLADFFFSETWTRPMPIYSIPGLADHH